MDNHKPTPSNPISPSVSSWDFFSSLHSWPLSLSEFPVSPGVYWFLDQNQQLLYVGKAKNLKNRLSSYLGSSQNEKNLKMLKKASFVGLYQAKSELHALLIEASLVRYYNSPYNIDLKDDKSPQYIAVTHDLFPKVVLTRINSLVAKSASLYGPFIPSVNAKFIYQNLRHIYPFCTLRGSGSEKTKPCFYFHLHLCPGACIGHISQKEYKALIHSIKTFLSGNLDEIKFELNQNIKRSSRERDYESAEKYKQTIYKLDNFISEFKPVESSIIKLKSLFDLLNGVLPDLKLDYLSRIEVYDIANLSGKYATGSMIVFQNGIALNSAYRHFHIKNINTPNDPLMLKEVVFRRLKHPEWPLPGLLILDGGKSQLSVVSKDVPLNLPMMGLAKNPDHLIIRASNNRFVTQSLDPFSPATLLLQQMRDEAHRFSRKLHHQTILKTYK